MLPDPDVPASGSTTDHAFHHHCQHMGLGKAVDTHKQAIMRCPSHIQLLASVSWMTGESLVARRQVICCQAVLSRDGQQGGKRCAGPGRAAHAVGDARAAHAEPGAQSAARPPQWTRCRERAAERATPLACECCRLCSLFKQALSLCTSPAAAKELQVNPPYPSLTVTAFRVQRVGTSSCGAGLAGRFVDDA
jgi:hypothetical protein